MDALKTSGCIPRIWKGRLALFGGFLINLSVGKPYTVGNMIPYMTSYIRAYGTPGDLTYTASTWLFALPVICSGCSMFLGGAINKKLGHRGTALLGAWIMSVGMMLTALSIKSSFYMVLLTDGVMFGLGVGIAYSAPMACAMNWYPENKGLACGFVLSGIGAGTCIFTQVQTAYVNPQNKNPDQPGQHPLPGSHDYEMYFSRTESDEILARVPYCFLLIGVLYAFTQSIGVLLLFDIPKDDSDLKEEVTKNKVPDVISDAENPNRTSPKEREPLINPYRERSHDEIENVHPLRVLQSRYFYLLWSMTFFDLAGVLFVYPLYKAFGFTFIKSDIFLTMVGSFGSICNSLGRIVWGYIADKYTFRVAMMLLSTFMCIFLMTLEVTRYGHKAMFFIWICVIFFLSSGISSLLPAATSKCFGNKYIIVNYGLLFSSQVTTAVISSLLATTLTSRIGYAWMFFIMGIYTILGALLAYFFDKKQQNKDI